MTIEASIARNRFGLGARPGDAMPGDAKAWLAGQFARYQSRPQPIATSPATPEIAAVTAEYLDQRRMQRQQNGTSDRRRMLGAAEAARADAMKAAPGMTAQQPVPPIRMPNPARQQGRDFYVRAVGARTLAALGSETPFVERLVHFWANHFAVSADKLTVVGLAGAFEFEAIRPHVLGSFRDLLGAVERHPAMLLYLDQAQSVGPGSPLGLTIAGRGRRKVGLNENLAREIMELHTLGVRTGYTQADVTEFARAMTGWTVAGLGRGPGARLMGAQGEPGSFRFAPRVHEPGERTILGQRFAQAGEAQADAVLDMLAVHPATARHIAVKLARHFAGDEPPPALLAKLEAAFTRSRGDLPTVYRALIDAPEAWAPQSAKFKSPWDWTISAMRGLDIREIPPQQMFGLQQQLGQPVWRPGSPAGYDDVAATWAGPDALMRRVEAAERLVARREPVDARERAAMLFPAALSPATTQAIARAESPAQGLALMLVAPEFLRR